MESGKGKAMTVRAYIDVRGVSDAVDKLKELIALMEKARSLAGDLAKELGDMSIEIEVQVNFPVAFGASAFSDRYGDGGAADKMYITKKEQISTEVIKNLLSAHKQVAEGGNVPDLIKLSRYLLRISKQSQDVLVNEGGEVKGYGVQNDRRWPHLSGWTQN